ncbi:MAG: beta-galactosidase [Armatimonadota bacterium]
MKYIPLLLFTFVISVAIAAPPVTLFIEAEATPAVNDPNAWTAKELAGASGGKVLYRSAAYFTPESPGLALHIPSAGTYRVWVRYFRKTPDRSIGAFALIRDEATEGVKLHYLDWLPFLPTEKPYEKATPPAPGFVWESFDVTFARPVAATIGFGGYRPGVGAGERHIDCVLATTDLMLNPTDMDTAKLPALATVKADAPVVLPPAPRGFAWSTGAPVKTEAFTIMEPEKRFAAGLINNNSVYIDGARMIRMGFNHDHAYPLASKWGIPSMIPMESVSDPAFVKEHPAPEGRFVNAQGQVGTMFSLHYRPWQEKADELLKQRVKDMLAADTGALAAWRIAAEEGGWLDYSPYAVEAFREWLKVRHNDIATLNARWGTQYASFDEITPAKSHAEGRASWLEFRQFSGEAYAESVGRRIPIIKALDPKRRPCLGANSNLDIAAPFFMAFRPNDFEELIRTGLKYEKYVSFDIYCADDDMGSSIEFLTSIAQGRKLINQEFSNHVTDPRIAARTFWMQVGKGIHGINLFMFQDSPHHATYPKWGLMSHDGTPKLKLAAYSDQTQEVHRLEPLLMSANYTHAVKPVALYWSRIDLGLDQAQDSWYGHSLNMPIHIYGTLRGLGYPVRWITPRQIAEGELSGVSALVMAGVNHVPQAAAGNIEAWVKNGGAVIADSWPGAFDEYGQPQATLAPIFGVRPAPKKATTGSTLALQQSTQGYGEVTDAAATRENYIQKIDECAQQPGATHPVAKALGDFMLAGYILDPVECVGGQVVAMTHGGKPCFIANDYGRGKALYSAMLLGTVWEAAPTRYEWDTTHAGLSYGRLLDAFLKDAGVRAGSVVSGLAPRVTAKLRVESPLITPDGNVLIALTSMNDDVVKPFDLAVQLPAGAGPFTSVLVATGGSRRLQPVEYTLDLDGTTYRLRMPSFDTHATILALKDAGPLVGLELQGVERGDASLATILPGQTFEVQATVYNPSPSALAAGRLTFTAPAGWLQSAGELKIPALRPGGAASVTFPVRAPQTGARGSIEPLLAQYASGTIKSTPTAEMVWWGPKPK